ncbi:MAG: DUF445 family protein [Defluviitaleaceae bacterium]|nr:DUF445 family protein [Defluviitaleaceae bacterium]
MHILNWLLPPVLGAVIAFSTNWIAIVMLFRPHTEKRIMGFRVPFTPGLVPREKAKLGRKLGEAIQKHLLTPEVLTQSLADPDKFFADTVDNIKNLSERFPELDKNLAELTRNIIKENVSGLASMFVNKDKVYASIKEGLVKYLSDGTNQSLLNDKIFTVAQNIPIADMVERKMAEYDVAEAESMILSVVGRELKIIVMLGGVFGFLIGLLSLIPLLSA